MKNRQELISSIEGFIENKQFIKAKENISMYEQMYNEDAEIFSIKAIISINEGELLEAKRYLEEGLQKYCNNFDLLYNLGYVYETLGESDLSNQFYKKAFYNAQCVENKKDVIDIIFNGYSTKVQFAENNKFIILTNNNYDSNSMATKLAIQLADLGFEVQYIENRFNEISVDTMEVDLNNILDITTKTKIKDRNVDIYYPMLIKFKNGALLDTRKELIKYLDNEKYVFTFEGQLSDILEENANRKYKVVYIVDNDNNDSLDKELKMLSIANYIIVYNYNKYLSILGEGYNEKTFFLNQENELGDYLIKNDLLFILDIINNNELSEQTKRDLDLKNKNEQLNKENERLKKFETVFEPGHYHSPLPNIKEIKDREEEIFFIPEDIPGINLNIDKQLELLKSFQTFYKEIFFSYEKSENYRYYLNNNWFLSHDAVTLYSFLRHFKPKRIIEVGSGFSSCVMLDTNEKLLNSSIKLTFIEPNPERFFNLLKNKDKESINLITKNLQDVDIEIFEELQENDILFIDSSHVSKIGSDVNKIIFEILPKLNKGVIIHFHDIFYPFEYPQSWIFKHEYFWNENYIVRAFLEYNEKFEIVFFNSLISKLYTEKLSNMPLCEENEGQSIWLRKNI